MRPKSLLCAAILTLFVWSALHAFQRRDWRRTFFDEDESIVNPADAGEKTEFVFARLRYPSYRGAGLGGYWAYRGNWTIDYPKADRHFVQGLRRLSRVHTRSVEHVVDLDTDDIFNYPWIYVVEPGHWDLTDSQAKKLRDYLLRGGFMMTDDFHGTFEWQVFMNSLGRVFPDRPVVELENKDEIFHVLYDVSERFQIPGVATFGSGGTHEYDGFEPRWRAIYDDKNRLMVAICHNMDLGDAWEHADHPEYPEKYSSLAYRVGINYIVYAMTH
jgi:hypothetical protein